MKKIAKNEFISLISDIITIISGIITIIPLAMLFLQKGNFWIVVCSVFVLILFAILLFIFRKKIALKFLVKYMNLTAPDKAYSIASKKLVYEYKSETEMYFMNEFYIKPEHDGVTSFTDKYRWSASDTIVPTPLIPSHKIEMLDRKYGYQQYQIKFDSKRHNRRDKPVKTGVEFKSMKDPQQKALPHLGTGIYDLTKNLTLEVWFPLNMKVINIRKLEYIHFTDEEHFSCEEDCSTEIEEVAGVKKQVIRYEIKNPIYGGKYLIDWDFN